MIVKDNLFNNFLVICLMGKKKIVLITCEENNFIVKVLYKKCDGQKTCWGKC
jgi:hypothetical protein